MNPILLKPTERAHQPGDRAAASPIGHLDAAAYHAAKPELLAPVLDALGRPAGPLRRRDPRGGGQPGRDQPARPRHREPAHRRRRRRAGHRRGRHRPGRRVRLAVRHRRAAARPTCGRCVRGLRDQQVPGRPGAARRRASPSWRPAPAMPDARGAAVGRRPAPRRRGLARARRSAPERRRRRWPTAARRRRRALPPHLELHRPRRPGPRAGRRRALREPRRRPRRSRPRRSCPGTKATVADLAWLRASGFDAALWPAAPRPPCSASAAATRCSGARSTTTSSRAPGVVDGLGWLAGHDDVRGRQGHPPAPGTALRPPVTRLRRSTTACTSVRPPTGGSRLDDAWGHERRRRRRLRRRQFLGTTLHGLFENDGFRAAFLDRRRPPPGQDVRSRRACRSPRPARRRSTAWPTCSRPTSTCAAIETPRSPRAAR